MISSHLSYDEKHFSGKFIRAVRRQYRRALKSHLSKWHDVRLADYKKTLRHVIHTILLEDRQKNGRPSPILSLSRKQYEHIAQHLVESTLVPTGNWLEYSRHPQAGEVAHHRLGTLHSNSNRMLYMCLSCGVMWGMERIADQLTYVPDKSKISQNFVKIQLEQEFESEIDLYKEELNQYGYTKLVRFN